MRTKLLVVLLAITATAFFTHSCRKIATRFCNCSPDDIITHVSVYATGLNNPRGLKFGPDGNLYVAEGGTGGTQSSTTCAQVVPPVGPYLGSPTGSRILKVSASGMLTTVADNLPSSQTSANQGSLISGVGDIAFVGNTLYGVLSGAGCSHGVPSLDNGVIQVGKGGKWSLIADLSEFQQSHPVAHPNPGDFEPDGTWYSMIDVDGALYAVEPNHGELDRISVHGNISRVSDISAAEGHIVPTAMTFHNGDFYIGNLDLFPIVAGSASIYKVTPQGKVSVYATGFTTVVGLSFDQLGGMYVLENTTGNPFPTPGTGDVVRVDPSGVRNTIVSGLNLPTAMTFGPDDKLYISNWGFGPPAVGGGQILQVDISCSHTGKKLE